MSVELRTARAATLGEVSPVLRTAGARSAPADYRGKPAAEMKAEEDAWRDSQPVVTRCALCDWHFEGTAAEGREEARAHREQKHPETLTRRTRRRRTSLLRPEQKLSNEEYVELQRERAEKDDQARLATIERGRLRDAVEAEGGEPEKPELEEASASQVPGLAADASSSFDEPGPVEPDPAAEAASSQSGNDGASTTPRTRRNRMDGNAHDAPGAAGCRWTRETIIEAIQAHAAETGFVPVSRNFLGPNTDTRPSLDTVKRVFGSWGNAVVAAGYPRPRRDGKPVQVGERTERAERVSPPARQLNTRPAPAPPAEPTTAIALRDPLRTADIPYDAEILANEAEFLRSRADALDGLAAAIRELARVSSREQLAA